ncbi:uncharacterized protein EKO05_0006863 [Ascochyta rabiei]|uniref:uncharacterized protein n=1 Tax=Didymella rabiei TaxID=5454 RepID=UPI0021FCA105|nr:uncharacterized protein EKO05_0006863 [Ascochyta rabiei]UPX16465.1 hypothetical protein EKO05_0006863 [Ascochyta rabiei]
MGRSSKARKRFSSLTNAAGYEDLALKQPEDIALLVLCQACWTAALGRDAAARCRKAASTSDLPE